MGGQRRNQAKEWGKEKDPGSWRWCHGGRVSRTLFGYEGGHTWNLDTKVDIREASDRGNCRPMAPQGSCVCDRKLLTLNLGKVTVGHIKDDIQCQGRHPTPRVTSNAKLRVGLI